MKFCFVFSWAREPKTVSNPCAPRAALLTVSATTANTIFTILLWMNGYTVYFGGPPQLVCVPNLCLLIMGDIVGNLGAHIVSGHIQFVCISGTDDSRTIPPVCRAYDIYPIHHHSDTDAESCVPSHSKVVQSLLRILWSTKSRGVSDHNHFVMAYIVPYHLGYWLTALLTIVITIPLAWVLQKVLKLVVRV